MKQILFLIAVLMVVSCSDRSSGYVGPVGGYNGISTYHNELVHRESAGQYVSTLYNYPLYFEYAGLELVLQSSNVSNDANVQVRIYDFDGNEIFKSSFHITGAHTHSCTVDLDRRPAYVELDIPDYQGNLIVTMKSFAG